MPIVPTRRSWAPLALLSLALAGAAPARAEAPAAAAPAVPPAAVPALKFEITIDIAEAPEMKAFAERAKAVGTEWYPKIAALLPTDGYTPPAKILIEFKKDYKGVAQAGGNRVTCSPKWFGDHPDDVGAIVHELTHVVQGYGRGRRPGWLVEGIADWVRFFNYEPVNQRPHPSATRAKYTDSYRVTAHFLDWAQAKYDKELVLKLNAACRQAKYSDDLWKQLTGKTMDELGDEWKASLAKK